MKTKKKSSWQRIKLIVSDFDGVFTDNHVYVFEDGREAVRCDRGDTYGLAELRKRGVDLIVISKERNPIVTARCKKLGIKAYQGIDDKLTLMEKIAKRLGIDLQYICYVGNDWNDVECMKAAGTAIAVADAYSCTIDVADYVTNARGGNGAVREVIGLVLNNCV